MIAAAAKFGLAPVTGSSTGVSVVGYLLGGGLGPLARSHGFSSDYMVGATVVTGTGDVLEVDAERHADLFWALRGGKFGLGIVTEVRIRLVELATVYGGSIAFAEDAVDAALRGWLDWTATADPRVTTSMLLMRYPQLDLVPEPLRGRTLLHLRFAFPGAIDEGERLAAPLRALAPAYLDELGELPASEIGRVHNDPTQPAPSWVHGVGLARVDGGLATEILAELGPSRESPFASAELRHLGAATHVDVPEGSAAGGRATVGSLGLLGLIPETFPVVLPEAAARLDRTVAPWRAAETAINFQGAPVTASRVATGWPPEVLARLGEVRRIYDPDRVFAY